MRKHCLHCGKSFVDLTRPGNKRFCSDNHRKRYSAERHRAKCVECGNSLGIGSAWKRSTPREWCQSCWRNPEVGPVAERGHRIEALWAEGHSLRAIASELGITLGFLRVEFVRLRAKGFDLPYRNRVANPKHRELAA